MLVYVVGGDRTINLLITPLLDSPTLTTKPILYPHSHEFTKSANLTTAHKKAPKHL